MKNQYFGDINDYRKYGLIRILANDGIIRTGVCWMLTPDDTRADGKFTEYLAEPKKYREFDPGLYDFLGQCLKANLRDIHEISGSDKFPNAIFYNPILEDDVARREQYFSSMFKLFQDADLIFFDPDNGLEIKSRSLGQKDSSKYLYWFEVAECYEAGHSILIYQHFIRENRDDFISKKLRKIHIETGSKNIISLQTPHVVFFLVPQDKHNEYFLKRTEMVSKVWNGQIKVSFHSFS